MSVGKKGKNRKRGTQAQNHLLHKLRRILEERGGGGGGAKANTKKENGQFSDGGEAGKRLLW